MHLTRTDIKRIYWIWDVLPKFDKHKSDIFICPLPDSRSEENPEGIELVFRKNHKLGVWVLELERKITTIANMP